MKDKKYTIDQRLKTLEKVVSILYTRQKEMIELMKVDTKEIDSKDKNDKEN